MTKNQFVSAVAAKTGKSKSEAGELVDAIFDTIIINSFLSKK